MSARPIGELVRGSLAVAAGIAASLAILSAAPKADAAGGREFFGVSPQTELTPSDFARMRAAGIGTVRVWLPWAATDPAPPAGDFQFTSFDATVAAAAAARVRVLPFVWGSPDWVVHDLDGSGCGSSCLAFAPRHRAALSAFGQFVAATVARYGHGGSFWIEHPELPRRPVKYWQIWNEQNSRDFFKPKTRPQAYAKLLRTAARAIGRADRSANVMTGGMAELAGSHRAVTGSRYLSRFLRIRGIEHAFDAIAVHPYGANVGGATAQVRRFRRVMVSAGDRRDALWITETGWSSAGGSHPLTVGRRGQAKRLRDAVGYYRNHRRQLHLGGVIWYSWRDSTSASCEWCARSGLLSVGGRGKPALRALRRVASGRGGR